MAAEAATTVAPALAGMTTEMIEASQAGSKAMAAAIAIGATGFSSALAEYGIGTAAVGATAENKDVFGLVLVLTVIPETIVIFGLVVALLLIFG
jgi:V/A-type H+/Na+-transporting ATPase subunit K